MPNLRSQEVNEKGIRMIASDGREFFMSTGQIKKQYDDTLVAKRTAMKLQAVGPIPRSTLDRSLAVLLAATILVLTVTAISAGYWPVLAVALVVSIASAFVLRRQSQAVSPMISIVPQVDPKPLPEVEAKAETATWLKSSIVAALGPEQISLAQIVADFREDDGVPVKLEIG